jgi:predicted lysophospholipase L1 biosynthesis ABC-type transport system permease subunit
VIGVAADVHDDGLHQEPPATIYWPGRLDTPGYQPRRVSIAIRTDRAGTESLVNQLHEAVWAVNPNLPVARMATLDALYSESLALTSFTLMMLSIAGAMALLLGVIGVYGVMSYAVVQRRREIGIRVALGAQAGQIQRLFVRRAALLAGIGIVLGLGGAVAFARWMRGLLFGVGPLDPVTYVTVPVVLAAAALMASYLPARVATTVDPVETMRAE